MAAHWTSETLSRLISVFPDLTPYIPWLASSRNDQNPNPTTASASHGGATPTCSLVVDNALLNPIAKQFQTEGLGKVVLEFTVAMTMGLLISQQQGLTHQQVSAIVVALSFGVVTLWNGMLLHRLYPRVAGALVYIGVGTIFVAYFGLVSSFLPPSLVWASWLCCGWSFLPFILLLVQPREDEEASSAGRPGEDIV